MACRYSLGLALLCFVLILTLPAQVNPTTPASATTQGAQATDTATLSPPAPDESKSNLSPQKMGDLYMARKMYREAIDSYKEALAAAPVLWNKMGIAYHQMGQLDLAKKNYDAAVKLDPKYAEAINNIGTIFYARKDFKKAESYYSRALQLTPKSASIYSNLGTALFARKKYDKAMEAYQKAIDLDPEVFEHRALGGSLLQERSVEERAKYHFYLSKLYAKTGQQERALLYMRMALEEGFQDRQKFLEDPEFSKLKDLPEFQELMSRQPRVL